MQFESIPAVLFHLHVRYIMTTRLYIMAPYTSHTPFNLPNSPKELLKQLTPAPRLPFPLVRARRGIHLAQDGVFEVFFGGLGVCLRGVVVDGEGL
jgi:hypothetical protein